MTPDSVHLLTRSSQMSLFRDGKGRVRRAYYGAVSYTHLTLPTILRV